MDVAKSIDGPCNASPERRVSNVGTPRLDVDAVMADRLRGFLADHAMQQVNEVIGDVKAMNEEVLRQVGPTTRASRRGSGSSPPDHRTGATWRPAQRIGARRLTSGAW